MNGLTELPLSMIRILHIFLSSLLFRILATKHMLCGREVLSKILVCFAIKFRRGQ